MPSTKDLSIPASMFSREDIQRAALDNVFHTMLQDEVERARARHASPHSLHESYAIIVEELDEFWEQVRRKSSERDLDNCVTELVQVAAMAQRAVTELIHPQKLNTVPRGTPPNPIP